MARFKTYFVQISLLVVGVVYIFTLRGAPGNLYYAGNGKMNDMAYHPPFESSQERGRMGLIISLAEQHTFAVDEFPEYLLPDLAWYEGHFYSAFPPGPSLVAVPFFLMGSLIGIGQIASFLPTLIISLCVGYVIYRLGEEICDKTVGWVAMMIYLVASPAWPYNITLSAHPYSALAVGIAAWVIWKIRSHPDNMLLHVMLWILVSVQLFIDYPNIVILSPCLLFILCMPMQIRTSKERIWVSYKKWWVPWMSVAMIPMIVLFVWFNMSLYHRPFALTNTFNLHRLISQNIPYDIHALSNDLFQQKSYSLRFNMKNTVQGIKTLLIHKDRGLFVYAPIFFMCIPGLILMIRKATWYSYTMLMMVCADIVLYASFDDPWGGWSFGPRYLIPVYPILCLFAAYGYVYLAQFGRVARMVLTVIFLYSMLIGVIGAVTTTLIPPDVEAQASGLDVGIVYALKYLLFPGTHGAFHWEFLGSSVPTWVYASIIYFVLSALVLPFISDISEDKRV